MLKKYIAPSLLIVKPEVNATFSILNRLSGIILIILNIYILLLNIFNDLCFNLEIIDIYINYINFVLISFILYFHIHFSLLKIILKYYAYIQVLSTSVIKISKIYFLLFILTFFCLCFLLVFLFYGITLSTLVLLILLKLSIFSIIIKKKIINFKYVKKSLSNFVFE